MKKKGRIPRKDAAFFVKFSGLKRHDEAFETSRPRDCPLKLFGLFTLFPAIDAHAVPAFPIDGFVDDGGQVALGDEVTNEGLRVTGVFERRDLNGVFSGEFDVVQLDAAGFCAQRETVREIGIFEVSDGHGLFEEREEVIVIGFVGFRAKGSVFEALGLQGVFEIESDRIIRVSAQNELRTCKDGAPDEDNADNDKKNTKNSPTTFFHHSSWAVEIAFDAIKTTRASIMRRVERRKFSMFSIEIILFGSKC